MKVFFLPIVLILFCGVLNAQKAKCQNIYVWEFADENSQVTNFTKDLTNAVEEAFVNLEECEVVQRRKIGTLQSQLKNESSVQSMRDMPTNIVQNLSTKGAEIVVFGVLNMLSKKEYELQLRIENLKTTKIMRMKSTDLLLTDLVDNSLKKKIINKLVHELVGIKYNEIAEGQEANLTQNDPKSKTSQTKSQKSRKSPDCEKKNTGNVYFKNLSGGQLRFFLREQHGSWGPNHDAPIITLEHDETKPILNLPSGAVTIIIHNLFIDKYDFIANHYHPEGVPRFYKNEQIQVDVCNDNSNDPIIIR